jgi:hypothetical protein
LKGIRLILYFGADPNDIGDPLGSAWPANSLMASFEQFHGMSPLRICRSGEIVSLVDDFEEGAIEPLTKAIQQLLLEYGGRNFQLGQGERWAGKLEEVSEGGLLSA